MAIIATPGASNANSFGTLAEAIAYFSTRMPRPEKWFLAQSDDREYALLQGAIDIDGLDFIGDRATETQALSWPRVINDTYELINDEFPFASNVVPTKIKYAQFEMAFYRLNEIVPTVTSDYPLKSWKVGGVEKVYDTTQVVSDTLQDIFGIPIEAARWLRGLRIPAIAA